MLKYTHLGGYGNINLKEAEEAIQLLPPGSIKKITLMELLYDYECLLSVIDGKACFGHDDGSETIRIKVWS